MDDLTLLVAPTLLSQTVDRFVPEIAAWVAARPEVREVVFLEDGSCPAPPKTISTLLAALPSARVVAVDPAGSLSVSIGAALGTVRTPTVALVDGAGCYSLADVDRMVARLSRADAVFGSRRVGPMKQLARKLVGRWRRWTQGVDIADPGCLLWAARSEAIEHVRLSPGSYTLLPWLIARRGFRVAQLPIDARSGIAPTVPDWSWRNRWRADEIPACTLRQWASPERRRAAA